MVPSIILLRAIRENLKTFDWILTEISAFKNIKVKIQILISFSLYLYRFFINNYMTGTIETLIYSALILYISCYLQVKIAKILGKMHVPNADTHSLTLKYRFLFNV